MTNAIRGNRGKRRHSALAVALVGALLVTAGTAAPSAGAAGKSGSKNCTGRGKIVLRVEYFASQGVEVAVKRAGPPSGPTWGVSVRPSVPFPGSDDAIWSLRSYVSPYSQGRWSAYTNGHGLRVAASCSRPAARTTAATTAATKTGQAARNGPLRVSLGDKKCPAGKKARVYADAFGKVNVGWKSGPSGPFNLVRLPSGSVIKDVYTNERNIYDVDVATTSTEGFHATGIRCYR